MRSLRSLAGEVVLVTGAARGVGRASARALARAGAAVACNGRIEDEDLRQIASRSGGISVPGDVGDGDELSGIVASTERQLGPVTGLVAHVRPSSLGSFERIQAVAWSRAVEADLTAAFLPARAVAPGMAARGRGRIVIVVSPGAGPGADGGEAGPVSTTAAATTAGLITLTKSLGRELAGDGIAVNAVIDDVGGGAGAAGDGSATVRAEQLAALICFLVSESAAPYIGQVFAAGETSARPRAGEGSERP